MTAVAQACGVEATVFHAAAADTTSDLRGEGCQKEAGHHVEQVGRAVEVSKGPLVAPEGDDTAEGSR